MPKPFHLAWFTNFTSGDWTAPFSHGGSPWDGKFFVEMAQAMERACFDYIMLEDTLMVSVAEHGGCDRGDRRRRVLDQHAVSARQPPLHYRDLRRSSAGFAAPRVGTHGI